LNEAIRQGRLRTIGGAPVDLPIEGALIRADRLVAYPIRDDIPVMLVAEGMALQELDLGAPTRVPLHG
jgi:uncharacterized protein YbaR (Trm112 family)